MKRPIKACVARLLRPLSCGPRPHTTAVILAGGAGSRMGDTGGVAKQWLTVGGVTVLERSVLAFEQCPEIDEIVVVARRGEGQEVANLLRALGTQKVRAVVAGGKTRQHSAYNGARRASAATRYIAIHDAARCLVTTEDITRTVMAAYKAGAACLGRPATDTVKRVNDAGYVTETCDRSVLWYAATPQVASYPMYMSASTNALRAGRAVTDDVMLIEALGQRVMMVEATGEILKITRKQDLAMAEGLIKKGNDNEGV